MTICKIDNCWLEEVKIVMIGEASSQESVLICWNSEIFISLFFYVFTDILSRTLVLLLKFLCPNDHQWSDSKSPSGHVILPGQLYFAKSFTLLFDPLLNLEDLPEYCFLQFGSLPWGWGSDFHSFGKLNTLSLHHPHLLSEITPQ